ncbi:MAG: 4-demethylwyosine synthase TYW1 [Thermoplasmata archaeon]|nr:4-demethylwyosine synthase TYW1 [Thermoplasmata archaeon]MCI4341281.1 4-demethylwyosine synthase TYW1 [Thermoplasmata archaeon]
MGDQDLGAQLADQGYQLTGRHSAVKLCYWTRESLERGRDCYKGRFYGIQSHRCLQMSPAIDSCNLHCRFCWRNQGWENEEVMREYDDPEGLLDRSIEAQRRILSGFGGEPTVSRERWEEARNPRHIAISLTGEPTLYPKLNRFLELCAEKEITTFLVTNGTNPDGLRALDPLPTQLYISVTAPNRKVFERLTLPADPHAWEHLLESLEILRGLRTRRVIRHTLVRGWNLGWESQYAELDLLGRPDFVEPKGYVYMGRSRQRLTPDHVPSHEEIRRFADRLVARTGYDILDESPDSKVLLLGERSSRRWLPGRAPAELNGLQPLATAS